MKTKRKKISEMNNLEKKHYSLEAKVFRVVVFGAVLMCVILLFVGINFYAYSLGEGCIDQTFVLSQNVALICKKAVDMERIANDVMTVYNSLPEKERAKTFTRAYRESFARLTEDSDYRTLVNILKEFKKNADVDNLYCGIYDEDNSVLIYIADPGDRSERTCEPGDWETINSNRLKIISRRDNSDGFRLMSYKRPYYIMCTTGTRMFDINEQIKCFVFADITLKNVIDRAKNFVFVYSSVNLVSGSILVYFLVKKMKNGIVQPINTISETAQNYIHDKRANGIETKNHFAMLDIKTGDEIETLGSVMADMEKSIFDYENNLKKITIEKERINTELSLARRIQKNTLPNIFPAFPTRQEFDIYATMTPAKEVGGDFYDFFLIDSDHLYMAIADVSGKGIPAAMFMMASKIMLSNLAMNGQSPAEILKNTNNNICANNSEEMFVTVWLGILEISTGKLTAANAGHEYPVLKNKSHNFELIKDQHGFVVGGMPNMKYKQYEIQLEPGDKLFIYTDGVPEAEDRDHNLFGTERMLVALNKDTNTTPKEILKNVRHAVNNFAKGTEQFDDLTMLCLEYRGKIRN